MIDMQDFLNKLKNDIESYKVEDLCQLSNVRPSAGEYDNTLYQKIYTYRFFRVYYLEYIKLARLFYQNYLLPNDIKEINVLSLGCGVGTDYYAMQEAFKDITFTYTGIDINVWNIPFLPNKASNYRFQCKSVSDLEQKDLNGINTLFIPKSISNWFEIKILENLIDQLSQNNITTLYVLFSSEIYFAEDHYKEFERILTNAGYFYETSYRNDKDLFYWTESHYWQNALTGRKYCSLYSLDFIYKIEPLECSGYLADCDGCKIIKNIPYTNSLMNFNYFVYKKLVNR